MLETVQRVASPVHAGVARESLTLRIGEAVQVVEVVRQPRHFGGSQAFWVCGRCAALRQHLYLRDGLLTCRVCAKLDYRSRHVLHPALTRAAKLRHRLGAAPGLLSPLPPKPPRWSRAYYARLLAELAAAESVIAAMLGATVRALKKRKSKVHGR